MGGESNYGLTQNSKDTNNLKKKFHIKCIYL